ncbi:MAG: hypothetical protein JWN48_2390 [Myxococcaceae bacterium]|nr:hypothetical protein [Myxococcaceae bacterium]
MVAAAAAMGCLTTRPVVDPEGTAFHARSANAAATPVARPALALAQGSSKEPSHEPALARGREAEQAREPAERALTVELAAARAGLRKHVTSGTTLQSGDALWFELTARVLQYGYLIQLDDAGRVELLYPTEQDVRIGPGETVRFPRLEDGELALDDRPGTERMLLITTDRPLSSTRSELLSLLSEMHADPRWPADWPTPRTLGSSSAASSAHPGSSSSAQVNTRGITFRKTGAGAADASVGSGAVLVSAQLTTLDHR